MAFDYTKTIATAQRLIERFGTTGAIVRTSGADETTYPPTPGSETSHACKLALMDYRTSDRDGTNITARDVKAYIAPDAGVAPQIGDALTTGGLRFHIVNVNPLQPAGTVVFWECQVRSGNT